jgi:hypothetical protein
VACLLIAMGAGARAQTRWTVDPRASLAWWQVNPHLNHLWATTCPEEPSWRPGEGRSGGWIVGRALKPPKQGYAAVSDTTLVPLYPRDSVKAVCTEAVEGQVVVADTAAWRGVRGEIAVQGAALITGEDRRDAYTRQAILETTRYPEIRFRVDSVVGVTRHADTLQGTAMGLFTLRHVSKPMTAVVRAWPEAGGLRVLAKFRIPAIAMTEEYGLSRFALGLGVTTRIWYDLFMGVDVVLRPEGRPAGN